MLISYAGAFSIIIFDIVNVVLLRKNRNHVRVYLMKGQSTIFHGFYSLKHEIFFLVKYFVLQRNKFILVSFLHSKSEFVCKRQIYKVFLIS